VERLSRCGPGGELPRGAAAQGVALPLRREEAQAAALVVVEGAAVARLVVVRGQLVQQLADAVPLPGRAGVRDLLLRQPREVHMHLNDTTKTNKLTFKLFVKGVAIDPTCINIGRLQCTEPNLMHFKWEVT